MYPVRRQILRFYIQYTPINNSGGDDGRIMFDVNTKYKQNVIEG